MKKREHAFWLILFLLVLPGYFPAISWAQGGGQLERLLNSGYDLLEGGKLEQAQKLYEEVLRQDPGHPLALNNLAAIMCKRKEFERALTYLNQALKRARGFKVTMDRVCNVEGVCAAYRQADDRFATEDLEGLIKSNIIMVGMAAAGAPR